MVSIKQYIILYSLPCNTLKQYYSLMKKKQRIEKFLPD